MHGRQGGPERARGGCAQAGPCRRPALDHVSTRPSDVSREGSRGKARSEGGGAGALRRDDAPACARGPRGPAARAPPGAPRRRGLTPDEEGAAAAGEDARVVMRLPRLRFYEILLLADRTQVGEPRGGMRGGWG